MKFNIAISVLVIALAAALVIQGFAGRQRRQDICTAQNRILDTLHDVVTIAVTPPKGKRLTDEQVAAITQFEAKEFTRINAARC